MTNTLEGIRDLIIAKLEALEIASEPIFGTVRFFAGDIKDYPAAIVTPLGWDATVLDTHSNERTFRFKVEMIQEISEAGTGKEDANEKLTKVADIVTTAFDQDKDLGGEVMIVNPVKASYDFSPAAGVKVFATLEVDVRVVIPNYSA